jgi:hypothetical protein
MDEFSRLRRGYGGQAAKLKIAHAIILPSFRAKSRNPVMKRLGNAASFFDSAALRSE